MQSIKCVAVGDGLVGKTSMLISYVMDSFSSEYIPTVFDCHSKILTINGNKIELILWDTAGQEDYNLLRPLSYHNTNVFFICFSIMDSLSFRNVESKWYPEIKYYNPSAQIIVVGTKLDLFEDEYDVLRTKNKNEVPYMDGVEMATRICAYKYLECSALTRKGLSEVFEAAALSVLLSKIKEKRHCSYL